MPTPTRSVVVNVGVGIADGNARRDTAAFNANYQTADGRTQQLSVILPPGGSLPVPVVLPPTSIITMNVDGPVRCDLTFGAVTVGSVNRAVQTAAIIVNRILVLDDAVTNVVIQNTSPTTSVRVILTQG